MTDIFEKIKAKRTPKRVPASFHVDAEVDRRIRALAQEHEISVSDVFRSLLDSGLSQLDKRSESKSEDLEERCPRCKSKSFHQEFFDDDNGRHGDALICNDCEYIWGGEHEEA